MKKVFELNFPMFIDFFQKMLNRALGKIKNKKGGEKNDKQKIEWTGLCACPNSVV